MATTLSGMGVLWAFLSLLTGLMLSVGFYMPYWLQGSLPSHSSGDARPGHTDVFVGLFRRCNYPQVVRGEAVVGRDPGQVMVLTSDGGVVELVKECGRYTAFEDIPSLAWKICTVLVGTATALTLCISFTTIFACCISDVFSELTARITGILQLLCALLVSVSCALYPHGWDSEEVKDICGRGSDQYVLGTCNIQWGYFITVGAAMLIFICCILSFKATKHKALTYNV